MNVRIQRYLWVDCLKSSITLLVVAHHSALAYTTFGSFNKDAYILSTHPVIDTNRSIGLDIFVNYNDIFFMSLMFFIGGLFVIRSIDKKGVAIFIKDRFFRLFLPFIIGGTLLMLLAYFPAFYTAHHSTDISFYIKDFFTTEGWPVGPPWFIWLLFAFNLVFVVVYSFMKGGITKLRLKIIDFPYKPIIFLPLLFAITWLLYVPVALQIGPDTWTGFGPFDFQVSRVLLYFGYFTLGAVTGMMDFNKLLFGLNGSLVKYWRAWIIGSALIFATLRLIISLLVNAVAEKKMSGLSSSLIYYSVYALSGTVTCIAFLTTFRRWTGNGFKYWNSLNHHAYVIYLVHYVFVTWIQFLLLDLHVTATLKFGLTFIGATALSWMAAILLKKVKFINRYI